MVDFVKLAGLTGYIYDSVKEKINKDAEGCIYASTWVEDVEPDQVAEACEKLKECGIDIVPKFYSNLCAFTTNCALDFWYEV